MLDPIPTRAELLLYVQDGDSEMLWPAAWLRAHGGDGTFCFQNRPRFIRLIIGDRDSKRQPSGPAPPGSLRPSSALQLRDES
jgi:hypothetical protein